MNVTVIPEKRARSRDPAPRIVMLGAKTYLWPESIIPAKYRLGSACSYKSPYNKRSTSNIASLQPPLFGKRSKRLLLKAAREYSNKVNDGLALMYMW